MIEDPEENRTEAPRRGRPRIRRTISCGKFRCYAPQCDIDEDTECIDILPDEMEVLRLVDLEGLEQEEAAIVLGISRKTLWKDLHEARRKVTDALVNGKLIQYATCARRSKGICPRLHEEYCPKEMSLHCPRYSDPEKRTE